MSQPFVAKQHSSKGLITSMSARDHSAELTPSLRRITSTRYAIGYKRPPSTKRGSCADLRQPLIEQADGDQEDGELPLCDVHNDLLEAKKLLFGSWVNLLLIFVPFGVISHFADWSASVTFFLNFLGMIPLASILGDATECLADHLGETIGGLLNATFGNAVEVI